MVCNLNCDYCYVRRGFKNLWGASMSLDKVKIIKKYIPKDSIIQILGGEPTLHKDFAKICELFKDHEIEVFTNGTRKLKDTGVKYSVTYHKDFVKKYQIERFLNNIKDIKINELKIMLDDLDTSLKNYKFFKDRGYKPKLRAIDDRLEIFDSIKDLKEASDLETFYLDDQKISLDQAMKMNFRHWFCEPCVISVYPDLSGEVNCEPFKIISEIRKLKVLRCRKNKCNACYLDGIKYDKPQL